MLKERGIVRIGDVEIINVLSKMDPVDFEIIENAVIHKMPESCKYISPEGVQLTLMMRICRFAIRGELSKIVESPKRICQRCTYKKSCYH